MVFQSMEEAAQGKANLFSTDDVIEAHNSKPGVTFLLPHNQFSLLVGLRLKSLLLICNTNTDICMYNIKSNDEKKSYFLGARPAPNPENRSSHGRSAALSDINTCPPASVYDFMISI